MQNKGEGLRPKFERRIYWALGILLVGVCALAVYYHRSLVSVDSQRSLLTERYSRSLGLTSDIRYYKAREDSLVSWYVLSGDPAVYEQVVGYRKSFEELIRLLGQVDHSAPAVSRLRELERLKTVLVAKTTPALERRLHGASTETTFKTLGLLGASLSNRMNAVLDDLYLYEREEFHRARERTLASTSALIKSFTLVSIGIGLGFAAIALLVVRLVRSKQAGDAIRDRLYEQIRKTSQARKETLETVSHDLKNPLSAVELNLQLIQKQGAWGNPTSAALRGVHAMKELIQSLLDQAKMESGTLELALKEERFADVLESAVGLLVPLAQKKRISMRIESDSPLPPMALDRRRMSQVISNIVGNAVKFTPPGGRIGIKYETKAGELRVSVSDTGPGIPKEQLEQVFERFWQSDATRKQGTGLGLAIARGVIEAHGGKIWVESAPGEGSTFRFALPLQPARQPKRAA